MNRASGDVGALIAAYCAGSVDDRDMAMWLKSVIERGMALDETIDLALAMARSGEIIDWKGVTGPIVDKHSTGGVGDAVTLIAVPIAAACGAKVAKLSGRALGHTGGTIDKLECIPGIRTDLPIADFKELVGTVGCAIASSSSQLAPADKRLYALRNEVGAVSSVPLIAASVMSKKIAAGADAVVLEVTFGRGALIESVDEARRLAETMRAIGERAGMRVATLLTAMNEPLANSVGDALELDEALAILEGRTGSDALRAAALSVAGAMLEISGLNAECAERALDGGRAQAAFAAMVSAQRGNLEAFERVWPPGRQWHAPRAGRISAIDARAIGQAVTDAKRGRPAFEARRIGVRLHERLGAHVTRGMPLLESWLPEDDDRLDRAVIVDAS